MLDSILGTQLTLSVFLACTAASLLLGVGVALVSTFRSRSTPGFAVTLAILPAVVQLVIMLVNGNLGTGVAIAGAFGLVRFRSAPGTAREISGVFLSMALGLATGMGYVGLAVVAFVILAAALALLTAKGQTEDRITGFNAGADDYLPKPFDPDELLSRVRAMLRRGQAYRPAALTYGDLTLDPATGDLSCGDKTVRLGGREFQIMELFLRAPRQVFSADRIMEQVWGWDNEAEINVVWVNISNLRKKLKSLGSHTALRANRGLGYLLEAEP